MVDHRKSASSVEDPRVGRSRRSAVDVGRPGLPHADAAAVRADGGDGAAHPRDQLCGRKMAMGGGVEAGGEGEAEALAAVWKHKVEFSEGSPPRAALLQQRDELTLRRLCTRLASPPATECAGTWTGFVASRAFVEMLWRFCEVWRF